MAELFDENQKIRLFLPDVMRCPQPAYADLRSKCPVGRMFFTNSPVVSRFEDVAWALRHPEIFSSEMDLQVALGTERPMIPQQIDPPAQTRYRRLLDPMFSRKKMVELVPAIREHASALIDEFAQKGECEFDSAFAIPLPCTAFLRLFGLPLSELPIFLELKDGIIRPHKFLPPGNADAEKIQEIRVSTGKRIYAYFEDEMARRRSNPGDDLLGDLLVAEIDGKKLEHNEILDICYLLLMAGLDTVTATLGCNIAYLASNPDQRRRIVENPALIPGAVEELLRWETPVTAVPRVAKRDVTLYDFEIKAGEVVTFLIGSANTDDAHFPDAQAVNFDRERNIHLAFGAGPHRCLGSHLARMELQVAMEEWHKRIPDYWIKPGETPTYSPGIREVMYLPLVWNA
jgi:cytochrome P450